MREPAGRPALPASGVEWASRASALAAEFVVPILIGAGLDRWRGTSPAGVLVGCVLGFGVGFAHVLRIARGGPREV